MRRSKAAALLLLFAVQCAALVVTGEARLRGQGDCLRRLRWSRAPSTAARHDDESSSSSFLADDDVAPRPKAKAKAPVVGHKELDRVEKLPGQPEEGVDFAQFAGYVTVDAAAGRALFYYLAEAAGSASAASTNIKPLLLWLNGGPGCSSLGYGALEELGPFRVMSDGKTLYRNPYAWNAAANVLFLESPAGVGFSYSNTTADYDRSGDNRTAEDAYAFLLSWMERFPEYKGRDFYIAGESYAGHYVPQLADVILRKARRSIINLKGIMIGNGLIHQWSDVKGMYDFYWSHALISDEMADRVTKHCAFTDGADWDQRCLDVQQEVGTFPGIDVYNIYGPMCQSDALVTPPLTPSMESYDPCTDTYVEAYLNNPDVQKALHANVTRLDRPWSFCGGLVENWNDSPSSMLPIIKELLRNGIKVTVFSGDTDGNVPVTSTRYSVNRLQLPVTAKWRPWFVSNKGPREVAGYVVQFKGNLSLVTVRGAGHQVPSYQPQRALALVQHFLAGKMLPDCNECEQD